MGVLRLAAVAAAAQLVLLALCANASAMAGCSNDAAQPTTTGAPDAAAALLCDMNALRVRNGAAPLAVDGRLTVAAQGMADDLASNHLFSHIASDGETLTDRVVRSGYTANSTGWQVAENIAWATRSLSSPIAVVNGWMDSTEHRRNLLDPGLTEVGIGIAQGSPSGTGETGMYYIADFGAPGTRDGAQGSSARPRACHSRKRSAHRRRAHLRRADVRRVHHKRGRC